MLVCYVSSVKDLDFFYCDFVKNNLKIKPIYVSSEQWAWAHLMT